MQHGRKVSMSEHPAEQPDPLRSPHSSIPSSAQQVTYAPQAHVPEGYNSAAAQTPHINGSTADSHVNNGLAHGEAAEESPDLLRWRADSLLDEMMLGGVDLSATQNGGPGSRFDGPNGYGAGSLSTAQSSAADAQSPSDAYLQPPSSASFDTGDRANVGGANPPLTSQTDPAHVIGTEPPTYPPGNQATAPPLYPPSAASGSPVSQQMPPGQYTQPYPSYSQPGNRDDTIPPHGAGVESPSRYAQHPAGERRQPMDPASFYAQQVAFRRELERKQWAISSGASNDYLTSVPRYEEAQNRTANYAERAGSGWSPLDQHHHHGYQRVGENRPDFGYHGGGIHANPTYSPQLGPIVYDQQQQAGGSPYAQPNMPFADRMSVGPQAQRHSNLLPRRSNLSVNALYEEMTILQAEVDKSLPIYGDTADRARHLLEKGRTILEQNPDRSAEVAYYVQQVRGIIQRGQQRIEWSNLYRQRLSRYLTAWTVLGLIGLIGGLTYGNSLIQAFQSFFPSAQRLISQHLIALVIVLSAGALGSAISALINMWRYSQKDYGFFDRKYGLLGIMLPIIGVTAGIVIYFVIALLFAIVGINTGANWILQVIPALMALLFGITQERIYGTSD